MTTKMCDCNQGRLPCSCKPATPSHEPSIAREAELQKLLATADQRVDDLQARLNTAEELLREAKPVLIDHGFNKLPARIDAFLKPRAASADYNYRTDLAAYFGLSYASWLTLPRVLMEAMPQQWQRRMAVLLHEYCDAYPNQPEYGTTVRITLGGRLVATPSWLVNYRHPDHRVIAALRDPDAGCAP